MVDRTMPALLRSLRNRVTSLERRISRGTCQLPDRLAPNGEQVTDWNTALAAGFYWSEDAANGPRTGALVGVVRVVGGGTYQGRLVQEVSIPTGVAAQYPMTWRRVWTGTGWTAWAQLTGNIIDWTVPALQNGFTLASVGGVRYCVTPYRVELQGGLYRTTTPSSFTTAFVLPDGVPRPRDQVRAFGRSDANQQTAITAAGEVQILATASFTSGIGYPLDGIGYAY